MTTENVLLLVAAILTSCATQHPTATEADQTSCDEIRVVMSDVCAPEWLEMEVDYWKIGLRTWADEVVERGQAEPEELRRIVKIGVIIAPSGTVTSVQPVDVPPLPASFKAALQLLTTMQLRHGPGAYCTAVVEWDGRCPSGT